MSKAIDGNKPKAATKRLVWYFNLYWKFMCTVKNNDKNTMNLPLPSFTVFLIDKKLPSPLRLWDFQTKSSVCIVKN